jgi:hypothetical protein
VGTVSLSKEIILRGKILMLLHLEVRRDTLMAMLTGCCNSLTVGYLEIVTSVQGISNESGTTFPAESGKIENDERCQAPDRPQELIQRYITVKYGGKSNISKLGYKHLQRAIWFITVRLSSIITSERFNKRSNNLG